MRAVLPIVWLLPTLLGCNALTGASDLVPVDCLDCVDSGLGDSNASDTARDTAPVDTARPDTAIDTDPGGCKIDDDCDDGVACTSNLCNRLTRACSNERIDSDSDGESPTTLGACGLDCNDDNKDVFSTQTAFFTTPYSTAAMTTSFDYNCDGREEQELAQLGRCANVSGVCTLVNAGWVGSIIPACGAMAKWAGSCRVVLTSTCIPV